MSAIVLVIDDNEGVRTALSVLFSVHEMPCLTAQTAAEGLAILERQPVGLVVQDMNFTGNETSGDEGVALFHQLRARVPDLPVILLTAWTHLETAVELVRAGAADYLAKPWDDDKLVATARNLLELHEATDRDRRVTVERKTARMRLERQFDLCGIVYESSGMHELLAVATKIASSDVAVLITGPNGAGKEKLAEIVQANSQVASGPFLKVNVGAIPGDLMEAELFGAEPGAYSGATRLREGRFEAADGGTLFLDEIANLSLEGQAKLLRILQTGEFERLGSSQTRHCRVRLISATNADLRQAVADGRFREDLYYRLNVIELELPSLADRRDDILPLAYHFLDSKLCFDAEAEAALLNHAWSGNVRELHNVIKRASLLVGQEKIGVSDLALPVGIMRAESVSKMPEPDREMVLNALRDVDGVVAKAARQLGLSRQALYRRMEKFGIQK